MGLSAAGALLAIALAYVGQTPGFMRRAGLDVYRLDLRVRAFTGYGFALLVLAIGFFVAGVPLSPAGSETTQQDAGDEPAVGVVDTPSVDGGAMSSMLEPSPLPPTATPTAVPTSLTPVSGAFGGLPPESTSVAGNAGDDQGAGDSESGTAEPIGTAESATSEVTNTPAPDATTTGTPAATQTNTPAPTATSSPTITPSPTPTVTPTPTMTPTPIVGETAEINGDGGGVFVYRSPGGQQIALVADNELVILLPGHANQGGQLWQEIMTLDGTIGWVDVKFLNFVQE